MTVSTAFLTWVLEQLAGLDALRSNRMFGGTGLYSRDVFFGLIDDDTVFFKTDESNIAAYRERNMPKFMPFPGRPKTVLGYHQVPADVIEDAETLVEWARKSIAVQGALQAAKRARTERATTKRPAKKVSTKPAGKKKARGKANATKATARRAKKSPPPKRAAPRSAARRPK